MIESFRVTDALRSIVFNTPSAPNLANPRKGGGERNRLRNLDLWRQVVTHQDTRITLARWNGLRLGGLVSARTTGGKTWEIDHLFLPAPFLHGDPGSQRPDHRIDRGALELLEELVSLAGSRQAERVVLRLPANSPAVLVATRAGFFAYFEETRWEGWAGGLRPNGHNPSDGFRVMRSGDEHGLFQLFNASTPAQVRMALAPTFERWNEVQSLWPGRRQEWVKEDGGKIVGWLGLSQLGGTLEGRLMAHPDHRRVGEELLELAFCRPGAQRWLVPGFQSTVSAILPGQGLEETGGFKVLINTVATPVKSYGMATVEA